jgi:uncharacterized protein (DUF488 family)
MEPVPQPNVRTSTPTLGESSGAAIRRKDEPVLYTVGHGTLEAAQFAALLRSRDVTHVVDVRSAPGSRHNPQFRRATMEQWLPTGYGISYRWEPDLGGFRRPAKDSENLGLRNAGFRGYADYMRTPAFCTALDGLLTGAARQPTVIMCSESVWWRCHRRLIADAATLRYEWRVSHLMHDGRAPSHVLTAPARLKDGFVTYPSA